jgi:8-oxo-dGTP pyrophosphatase MutT (NUDIX family)
VHPFHSRRAESAVLTFAPKSCQTLSHQNRPFSSDPAETSASAQSAPFRLPVSCRCPVGHRHYAPVVQQRPSSRLLVLNSDKQVLLFRFEPKSGPLTGHVFWATPGGGLDAGESFEDAARRELYEEVGIQVSHPGPQIAQRTAHFALPTGELVEADERYFLIDAQNNIVCEEHRTELEREVMVAHRWWSQAELQFTPEQIWPEDLAAMLIDAASRTSAS